MGDDHTVHGSDEAIDPKHPAAVARPGMYGLADETMETYREDVPLPSAIEAD